MDLEHLTVADLMTTAIVSMKPGETLGHADVEMKLAGIRHIPVVDDRGHLVGMLSNRDLLSALHGSKDAKIRVSDVMTKQLHTVEENTEAHEAAALMMEHKIGALPVTGDEGQLVGLVTETDFVRIAHRALGGTPVE